MKIKYHSKYNTVDKNGKGIVMFRYTVSGSDEQLEAFKAAQGEFFRAGDDGQPLFFTPNYIGETGSLGITAKGKIYADTAAIDKAVSLINRYPGQLGQEIAKLAAAQLLGNMGSGSSATVSAPAVAKSDAALDS